MGTNPDDRSGTPDPPPGGGWTPPAVSEVDALIPGRYEVLELLGAGGMAAVYKARQRRLGRLVAIKVLPGALASQENDFNFTQRFEQEARAMANLSHPGIVHVYDFGEAKQSDTGIPACDSGSSEGASGCNSLPTEALREGRVTLLYFVMEYIDGMDVVGYLREHGGKLPEEYALTITAHVLDALAYAHDHGIIHRDIKPANVLINSEGQVKIADFGLAKHGAVPGSRGLTKSNMAMGTPDFVAPEALIAGAVVDHRADLYAVGVMLYQMLTGELPRGRFKLPAEKVPGLDRRIDPFIDKAMAYEPEGRYQSATEMRNAVDELFTTPIARVTPDSPSTAIPVIPKKATPPPGATISQQKPRPAAQAKLQGGAKRPAEPSSASRKPALIALGSALGLALIGVLAWLIFRPSGSETGREARPEPPPETATATPASPVKPKASPARPAPETKGEPVASVLTKTQAPSPLNPKSEIENQKSSSPAPTNLPKPSETATTKTKGDTPSSLQLPTTPPDPKPTLNPEPGTENAAKQPPGIPEFTERADNYAAAKAERIAALTINYAGAVDREIANARSAGDLDKVVALRAEKTRLEKKEPLPGADPPDLHAGLAELRDTYRTEVAKIEAELLGDYRKSLNLLIAELTRQGNRDHDALAVKAFRQSLPIPPPGKTTEVAEREPPVSEPSVGDPVTAMASGKATRDKPFENSLGMRFVPVPITGGPTDGQRVLFSVWETRVADYEKFIRKDRKREWPEPDFKQDDDHPAVNVTWEDAVAFCEWLTEEDHDKGVIGKDERYRLPSDHEWSCAVGIGKEEDAGAAPAGKDSKLGGVYPWGKKWPPPSGAGNYYGKETKRNPVSDGRKPIEGYDDGFDRTAPVGSFEVNEHGLHDLGGNVWEWCEDWFDPAKKDGRVLRGAAWGSETEGNLRSSNRGGNAPTGRSGNVGFRLVVAGGGG